MRFFRSGKFIDPIALNALSMDPDGFTTAILELPLSINSEPFLWAADCEWTIALETFCMDVDRRASAS